MQKKNQYLYKLYGFPVSSFTFHHAFKLLVFTGGEG